MKKIIENFIKGNITIKEIEDTLKNIITNSEYKTLLEFYNISKSIDISYIINENNIDIDYFNKILNDNSMTNSDKVQILFNIGKSPFIFNKSRPYMLDIIYKELTDNNSDIIKNEVKEDSEYFYNIKNYFGSILLHRFDNNLVKSLNTMNMLNFKNLFTYYDNSTIHHNIDSNVLITLIKNLDKDKKDFLVKNVLSLKTNIITYLTRYLRNDFNKEFFTYLNLDSIDIITKLQVAHRQWGNINDNLKDNLNMFLELENMDELKNFIVKVSIYNKDNRYDEYFKNSIIDRLNLFNYPYQLILDIYIVNKFKIELDNNDIKKILNIITNKSYEKDLQLNDKEQFEVLKEFKNEKVNIDKYIKHLENGILDISNKKSLYFANLIGDQFIKNVFKIDKSKNIDIS